MKMRPLNRRRLLRRTLIAIAIVIVAIPLLARLWVHSSASDRIYSSGEVPACKVALVLGTQVYPHGRLSERLASRCDTAIELYKSGKVRRLLMSGDGRDMSNNEPQSMRDYAIRKSVPADAIAVDEKGYRTYDSIWRAKHVYGLTTFLIVTQGFHLDRSVFLGKVVGVDAYGVSAALPGCFEDQLREPLACTLALIDAYFRQPHPAGGKRRQI